jgi:UDP-GlcNAc:undecaprenyl-phosphate GlcNAc-1-phosphate transferase
VLAIAPMIFNRNFLSFLFVFLWLITSTNAHNFIDGLDGLCTGISVIEAISLGIIFLYENHPQYALLAFVLGGSCIGFYPYNAKNAKIFMGDTGSTFLGFVLGLLAVKALKFSSSHITLISMCFIFIVPMADIIFAVIRRSFQGKNPFMPDRSHIHHILSDSSLGHYKASLVLRVLSMLFAITGILLFIIFS